MILFQVGRVGRDKTTGTVIIELTQLKFKWNCQLELSLAKVQRSCYWINGTQIKSTNEVVLGPWVKVGVFYEQKCLMSLWIFIIFSKKIVYWIDIVYIYTLCIQDVILTINQYLTKHKNSQTIQQANSKFAIIWANCNPWW